MHLTMQIEKGLGKHHFRIKTILIQKTANGHYVHLIY